MNPHLSYSYKSYCVVQQFPLQTKKSLWQRINEILKSLKSSDSLSDKQYKNFKAVGSRDGVIYGICKVHKAIVDVCPPFRPILPATGTPTFEIAKFLVPILSCLTINDSFSFAKEIVEQDSTFYMCRSDVESLFTNIPIEETVNICIESMHDQNDSIKNLNKSEFK